jgi:hypothetical protein
VAASWRCTGLGLFVEIVGDPRVAEQERLARFEHLAFDDLTPARLRLADELEPRAHGGRETLGPRVELSKRHERRVSQGAPDLRGWIGTYATRKASGFLGPDLVGLILDRPRLAGAPAAPLRTAYLRRKGAAGTRSVQAPK